MSDPLDYFNDFGKVQKSFGSSWIVPGKYELEVKRVIMQRSQKNTMQHQFVAEFSVLSTDTDYAPGDHVSWIQVMTKQSALNNIKAFICALMDAAEGDVTRAVMAKVTSADQPAQGMRIKAVATTKEFGQVDPKTGKRGSFTYIDWTHVPADGAEAEVVPF